MAQKSLTLEEYLKGCKWILNSCSDGWFILDLEYVPQPRGDWVNVKDGR